MDTEPDGTDTPRPGAESPADREAGAPPLPDDPRVPQPEDAGPSSSQELGGAAPAVGPGAGGRPGRPPSGQERPAPTG